MSAFHDFFNDLFYKPDIFTQKNLQNYASFLWVSQKEVFNIYCSQLFLYLEVAKLITHVCVVDNTRMVWYIENLYYCYKLLLFSTVSLVFFWTEQ